MKRPAPKDKASPSHYAREFRGRREPRAIIKGQDRSRWTDVYHAVLTMPWWTFFCAMGAVYVGVNAVFALLYLADPGGIANAHPGSFWDAFFFSMQTLGTLGGEGMAPKDSYIDTVVTVESFFSVVNIALATGIVFARFSRPKSRVIFSKVAVVTDFDGVPTLMFRAANQRGNQILEAQVSLWLARQVVTREGHAMRRLEELRLVRSRTPLFALSWTVMHTVDESSPFYGTTLDTMLADQFEIIVMLSGMDDTYADKIYARHSYLPQEILAGKRFVDILSVRPDGRRFVDLRRFHDIETVGAPPLLH